MLFFFFNDTATTEIYTLSLHDALPIYHRADADDDAQHREERAQLVRADRSEEHTSELQSQSNLVCRLLLEKNNEPEVQPSEDLRELTRHSRRGFADATRHVVCSRLCAF